MTRKSTVGARLSAAARRMYAKPPRGAKVRVRVGTAVVVRNRNGYILLELRSDNGLWGLPGGRIEPRESVEQAAIREVKEETGLTVKITRLLGVYSGPAGRIVTYPGRWGVVHLVDVLLEARVVSGRVKASRESEELRYFRPNDLPARIAPPARAALRDVAAGRRGMVR